MTLQDIYDQLAYGELRMLSIGTGDIDNTEGFPIESFVKLLPTIQLGLTELHKKFLLREGHITIPLVPGQVSYVLRAGPNMVGFDDNIFKFERIYGKYRQKKYEIPLNRIDDQSAIRTTSYNTMLVPNDPELAKWLKETTELEIVYRADHPKIRSAVANSAPLAANIDLPVAYLQALLYFTASRLYNPIGMNQEFHEGNNYAKKYEQELMNLYMLNLQIDGDAVNDRVMANGWV